MRITVFGAGAMGTLYGARLAAAGHEVTMVARGRRRAAIDASGLRVRVRGTEPIATHLVRTIERLDGHQADVVLVLVRAQQLEDVLTQLAAHRGDVAMMVNVAVGYDEWRAAMGARFFVGFPGATGRFVDGDVVEYELAPAVVQPTVIGEPSGDPSPRVSAFAAALREAGFPVEVRADMEAWQRTHAAWITPFMLTAAIAAREPDSFARPELLLWCVDAMRECLAALRSEGLTPTPAAIRVLGALPRSVVVTAARALLASRERREHLVSTGVASADEGLALANDIVARAREASCLTPRLEALADAARSAHRPG